ncbi:hypothetical protein [Sphingomonas sp.]|uniref:hypothetical protein n=1 Tax=Sphingomonas sp. TaxID=28214 RepID=UPI0035C79A85
MRKFVDYTVRGASKVGQGFDPDQPVAGFYRMRLVSGGVYVGIRIWHGRPIDPVTGEEMDRSLRWQAQANGEMIEIDRVWPQCARDPVSASEYAYLFQQQRWGERQAPESPQADPTRRADPLSSPILF